MPGAPLAPLPIRGRPVSASVGAFTALNTPCSGPVAPFVPVLPMVVLTAAALLIAQAGVTGRGDESLLLCFLGIGLLYLAARLDGRSGQKLLPARTLDISHPVGAGLLMVFPPRLSRHTMLQWESEANRVFESEAPG